MKVTHKTETTVNSTAKQADAINQLDAMVEWRKNEMLKQAAQEGSYIVSGWWNWFCAEINQATDGANTDDLSAKVQAHFDNDLEAWTRARDLFFTALPVHLGQLRDLVCTQIEFEFQHADAVTASDVSGALRRVDTYTLLRAANYSPEVFED